MRIVRGTSAKRDFTILPNATLRDEGLSYRARGVLAYVLSHVDGWETNSDDLARKGKEGRDAIRTALVELQVAGYVRRTRVQDPEDGRWSTVTEVHERPSPTTDFQASGDQSSETQASDSQALSKKTIQKIPQPPQERGRCARHVDQPGVSCRACGTSPRAAEATQARESAALRRQREAAQAEAQRRTADAARVDSKTPEAQARLREIRREIRETLASTGATA